LNDKESQSVDEFLKAQGFGWAKRKVADHLSVSQDIVFLSDDEVVFQTETSIKSRENALHLDGNWHSGKSDQYGDVQLRCFWEKSPEGTPAMIAEMVANHEGVGKGTTVIRRTLINGGNQLLQIMSFQSENGANKVENVKRVFDRV